MKFLTYYSLPGLIIATCMLTACNAGFERVSSQTKDGQLIISIEDQPVLSYQFEPLPPPEGVNPNYERSGFLHPVNTPSGQRLTRIHPEDHFHHFGIWNPWTHTLYEGDTLDFWNIGNGRATIRFARFDQMDSSENHFRFQALHKHVLKGAGSEKTVLNEVQDIKVTYSGTDHYFLDLTFNYRCTTDSPFSILEYRYGGLGWRATEMWNAENSQVLTSSGKSRDDADGSRAKWCIIQGKLEEGNGGFAMMSHPDNFNHPEPLRIWPSSMHEGNVFANFAPTKDRDWHFEPGQTYQLRYRLVVFDGQADADKAEAWWNDYVEPY